MPGGPTASVRGPRSGPPWRHPGTSSFLSQQGKLRDRSNTSSDLRDALDQLGFSWVTSHTFRKTAATLLDESGLTVRKIADQIGHADVSMTQDVYFGRRQATKRAAEVTGEMRLTCGFVRPEGFEPPTF